MTHSYKYSLGIYVNRNFASSGGSGNPHVFLGLKKEKVKCNELQIQMKKEQLEKLKSSYSNNGLSFGNIQESIKQYEQDIKQMQCFINEETLEDLKKELSQEKYQYNFTSHKNFKAWSDTDLNDNKDFDKNLRETFNNDFTFLRQCYADITEPFFEWLEHIKKQSIADNIDFTQFEKLFNEFVESPYSNIFSIEGFFGFGPYQTGLFKNYKDGNFQTGGKVFQNNHWNDDFEEKTEVQYDKLKEELKDKPLPRIPLNSDDKQYFIYSKDFILTDLRPLKTFQEYQSEVMSISESQYKKICKSILFQTLLTSDKLRENPKIFGDKRNVFKNYKVVGNSCVDFVMDKLRLIGASKFHKATAIIPYDIINHIQNMIPNNYNNQKGTYKKPLSKGDKISFLLYDFELFYQNYSTLCNIDSTWACEEGLKSFNQYCEFLLHSNLLHHTRLNRLTDNITNNQLKSLARNTEIEQIEDDVNMRLNTHFCLASYFQDRLKYEPHLQTEVALIIYDDEKEHYLKADSQSKFAFSEFSYDRNMPSHNIALWYEQPILFAENPYPLAIHIQENIFNNYPKYFAQCIVGNKKDYGDYRNFLKQEEVSNA
ncbi:hypothetical protein [Helicobacter hepaticus]|jgi:hypothetical protein|uniref:Uncharacterized protein n=1 Tax=Helicobacter hepaticus (strain ATCC 51449 / 3B1) TaxID=235279 RepID=Q7VJI3_HELHP|nr:hypothetical protein [Helicobacter hepaticus]AAP76857.1 conserved hypothetical protein [Helicobacter hepaticus ATCC 51449]